MLGIVFCGGKSLRMGRDKGLIPLSDKNWAMFAAEKLHVLNIPVRISINAGQLESYKVFFPEESLLLDQELLGIGGPLLGLLSAHVLHPNEDLFVLACDLPLMKEILLQKLISVAGLLSDFDAFVFTREGELEPLCAIYRSTGLRKILNELHVNGLSKFSMKSVLSMLQVYELAVSRADQDAFQNFNTHDLT
jgi:molybdopterin-guanine dinucleotide biosynthesis protein A